MKNVIITGAGGGLGTTTVKVFLQKGYRVIALVHNGYNKKDLPESPDLIVVPADLSDEQQVSDVINELIREHEVIDACLLLAGGYAGGDIFTTTLADIKSQVALNFDTAYNVVHSLFPHFIKNGKGRIIFIGAQPPLMPKKGKKMVAYSLSKSLLFQLAEILNEETRGTDVVAAVVVPSTLDTDANRKSMPDADFSKWVKTEQLAETLEFLCSDNGDALREPVLKVYNKVI
jgi:NAD(P)-dependent dehydrogenase (short-subunit alcohol dehydrogenase family)